MLYIVNSNQKNDQELRSKLKNLKLVGYSEKDDHGQGLRKLIYSDNVTSNTDFQEPEYL